MPTDTMSGSAGSSYAGSDIPSPDVPEGVEVIRDVSFGPHERQRYDVYLPAKREHPCPVLIFFHPGAWSRRDKRAVRMMFALEHGFALVSVGYRLAQHAPHPAQIQDVRAGVEHILRHASQFGIDERRIVLAGTSAGAHLASLLVLAQNGRNSIGIPGFYPKGVIAIYGAYDLNRLVSGQDANDLDHTSETSPLGMMLGAPPATKPEALADLSPINFVHESSPPFFIAHGREDQVLPWEQSATFASALAQKGVEIQFSLVDGAGHGDKAFREPPMSDQIINFLKRVTQRPSSTDT